MKKKIFLLTAIIGLTICLPFMHQKQASMVKADSIFPEDFKIVDISAGTNHSLAIDQFGNLWAWGSNSSGQLGRGNKTNSNTPVQIMKGHKFKKISAGNDCSAAIDENGYLYGWGKASSGPQQNNQESPFLISSTNKYKEVTCGYDFTATLLSTQNDLDFYYGYGYYSTNPQSGFTYKINNNNYPAVYNDTYRYENKINGTSTFSDAGEKIISADGEFWYCGSYAGSSWAYYWDIFLIKKNGGIIYLHNASTTNPSSVGNVNAHVFIDSLSLNNLNNIPMKNVAIRRVVNQSSTTQSTVYFVGQNGFVYSAGFNGSLALLGNEDTSTAVTTTPAKINSLSNIKKVSAGENHVLALTEDGKVYSWGDNTYGQLGLGDNGQHLLPSIINKFNNYKQVSLVAFTGETNVFDLSQNNATSYTIKEAFSKGSASFNDNGQLSYAPNSGSSGIDEGVVTISYGSVSIDCFVSIKIDSKPIVVSGTPSLNVECGATVNGRVSLTDADGDTLTFSLSESPSIGTVRFIDNFGSFTYTARTDVAGGDSFVITVSDGYCNIDYPVSVHVHSLITYDDDTDIKIDMNSVDTYSGNINALDIDGDTLSYSILTNGTKGTAVVDSEGNYTYTASGNFYGDDTFVIRVDDGYRSLDVTYTVHLYAVSDFGTKLINKITKGTTFVGNISTNAKGVNPIYSIFEGASKGQVSINSSTGQYTYVPTQGSAGDDTFVVLVDYIYGQYTITIHVYQNTVPNDSLVPINLTVKENEQLSGSAECADIDGDVLSYSINKQPDKGALSLNYSTGAYLYNPNQNIAGNDSFKIDVFDSVDKITIQFNVHIESEIQVESSVQKIISQNTSLNGNVNASDKDGDALVYSIASGASHGVSNIDTITGDYVYVPFNNYFGEDSFVVKVDDGVLAKLCTIHVTVNRKPISDHIAINLVTKGVTATGTAQCSDPDGDTLTYSLMQEPSKGSAIVDTNSGAFAYTPNLSAAGDDTFTIKASDGTDDIIITINVHNETDVELDEQATTLVVNQGKSTTGQVLAIDLDGDALTYSINSYPTQGTVNINASTGAWTFNALKTATGTDAFSVKVTDGNSEAIISYNLIINTPATFGEDSYSFNTNQGNNYVGQVTAVDSDGDALTFSIVSQGQKGSITIDPSTGRYLYTPNQGEAGNDTFVIGVSDGNFVSEVEVHVHIESEITIPNSTITHSVDKNGIITGNVNASDQDGDALTYSIYTQGQKGNATIMGDGGYSYFANEGAGDDSFIISVTDGVHINYVTVYVHISSKPYFEESAVSISVPQNGSVDGQVHGQDEDGDSLLYEMYTNPSNGVVNLNSSNGKFTYTSYSNSSASSDSFVISITDGKNYSYVTVNVVINNAPRVDDSALTIKQGKSGQGTIAATDPENDKLTYELFSDGVYGKVSINSQTGEYTYVSSNKEFSGEDSFVVSVSDGYTTINVTVKVTITKNSKPTSNGAYIELKSGSSTTGKLIVNDTDGDVLKYTITAQGNKGTAYINEQTGEFTYSAFKDTEGYDCFIVTVDDGFNKTSYMVEVDITFVDSYNSWAIPTTVALGVVAVAAIGVMAFVLIKAKKRR